MTPIFERLRKATMMEQYHVFVLEGGSRCFAPDTLVVTDQGSKNISDIKVGDMVKCIDEDKKVTYRTVVGIHHHVTDKPMVEVRLKNGGIIRCSADHKFLYKGEYVPIIDILKEVVGNIVLGAWDTELFELNISTVDSWGYIDNVPDVYDVEVETAHNYFISAGGEEIDVHNSSKTHSLIQFFVYYAMTHRDKPNRVVIARKKGTWLYATVWNDFTRILTEMNLMKGCSVNKTLKVITLYTTTFEFIGLDDVQKLHGLTTDIFWINEAMEATKDDFDQLEQRTSRFSILDYNPSAEEHWIYDNVCTRDDCYFDHSTMLDNPFIPENSRRKILSYEPTDENYQQGTADERKWKIYGLGMRAKIEGLIFTGYEIVKEIPEDVDKRWYAVDFGYTNDPTAILEVAYNGHDLFIDEHCYSTGMLTDEIRDILAKLEKKRRLKIISESADPRMVAELRKGKFDAYGREIKPGLPIVPVRKYNGSIEAGIDFMKSCKIFITSRSLNVKHELDNYTYAQDKTGKWLNIPEDDNNHALDACRYVCLEEIMARNGKPVSTERIANALHR